MKNKPIRHKADNTFRFIPFSERIANIDVDVFHRVAHEYETEEEEVCYLYQCIQKWNVLNLTEGYDKFKRDVEAYSIITLPQLLHKQEHVIQVLLKHLKVRDTLYLQPLLDILVAVAKDLRKEFSQYYQDVLNVLVELLNTNNPEPLEWTFTCLAYMFKFLWRSLVKNVKNAFVMLLPLLSDSKPNYIREFAAESFAFIVRKVKDKKTFLQHMISIVREREDGADGCGKLLFETIHGVTGQFHSCAEEMLHFLLQSLSDTELQDTLFEVLIQLVGNTVTKIHAKNSEVFWNTLVFELKELFGANTLNDDNTEKHIDFLLQLCGTALEYRQGKFFHSNKNFVQGFIGLNVQKLSHPVLLTYCKVTILLLLSENIKLSQENASSLTRKITNLHNEEIFLYFIDNIHKYTGFEALILPNFLKLCFRNKLDEKYLHLLTKIILQKSPLCGSGISLDSWRKYTIDFGHSSANREMIQTLSENIVCGEVEKLIIDPACVLCSLICLPHIATAIDENLKVQLHQFIDFLCENINIAKMEEHQIKLLLFLLQVGVETLVHFSDEESLLKCLEPLIATLLPLARNVEYLLSLKILDLLFSALMNQGNVVHMQTLLRLNEVMQDNFSSPYHEIRLFTSHIYTIFGNIPEFGDSTDTEEIKAFNLCYQSESLEPQVNTFRDQLRYLEYLTYGRRAVTSCSGTACSLVPLRYLCGVLYMNFQLLWEPVTKIIASYGQGLKTDEFWTFFGDELKKAMENVKCAPNIASEGVSIKAEFLNDVFQNETATRDKPDFLNYCALLWKAMTQFPSVVEEKNRVVVELVLDYINNSENNESANSTLNCNIMEKGCASKDDEIINEDDNKKNRPSKKYTLRLLSAQLEVLSKMRNPKALYREPELNRLYFELLSHKNPEIQKEALNCIMTYKYKYLVPYQKNLENLIDEKNFKNELVLFRVDSESTLVQKEHREGLMPVVIQIVFAKMTSKVGLRTGGKSSSQYRRNIILRFLAGCTAEEMKLFINKAFRMYYERIKGEQEINIQEISRSIDLQKFLLPKRLLSSLNLLQLIFEHFGGLLSEMLQRDLLKILLIIGLYTRNALETSVDVHAGYLPPIRMARTVCLKVLAKFFKLFEEYPWTANELNAIFDTFVWPYVEKLPCEGIYSPTALLKLFSEWCSIPKYFPLLVKLKSSGEKDYILQHVVKLLLNSHCKASVVSVILEMLENLLTLQMDVEEDNAVKIPVDYLKPIEDNILKKLSVNEKLNYGSCILLPLVPSVLEKIKLKLESNRSISQRELSILSRISELVWEPAVSDNVLQIFLPIVLKRCSNPNEEIVNQQLSTVYNLLNNVEDPLKYVKEISPMFAAVTCNSGRKILCQMLQRISDKNNDFKTVSDMILALNAWDAKWVDQPDFEKRISALKQIQELVDNNSLGLNLGILLIYNCYYIVTKETDLSLKDYGSHSLKILIPTLIKLHKPNIDYILNETVFVLIRNGFKNRSDEIRHECIMLLGCMARECADAHVVLQDLNKFANKVDLEVDCFENLTHMQLHRHVRAMLKISQVLKELTTAPSSRTLTQFLLPMVTFYLCNEKYTNKNSLLDAVVEAMNTISHLLPWHQYIVILKFYLRKLQQHKTEYQRQLVRIITAILDGFHYDLSKGQVEQSADSSEPKLVPQVGDSNKVELKVDQNVTEAVEAIKTDEENEHISSDNEGDEEVLAEFEVEEEEIEVADEDKEDVGVIAVNKTTVLSKSAASRVIRTIEMVLLPQLHRTLAEMTHYEEAHKVNRKKTGVQREEEDLVRVPISLAVVKLLQKLPKHILDRNLPRVFIKTCTFLRSHLESVRRVARETLQNILKTLGPDYLKVLLAEMVPLLNRGYQLHVLVYTIHAILNCLRDFYKPGDINEVLITVLHICKADLFGAIAEEKEVVKIARKTSEAKSTKTYDTFKLLAQFITESCLLDLLLPVKEVLMSSHSYKIIYRAQECLRHVAIGLTENEYLPVESLLKFAYGVASESIPQLISVQNKNNSEKREQNKHKKADCFILPENPGRAGAKPQGKLSFGSNSHHLIQFALRLCHFLLKHDRIKEVNLQGYLDPFISIFKKCLMSRHVKLSTAALQCLCWTMKYNLPSVKENVGDISEAIFDILHKYAAATLSKGENYDLVVAAFKAVTVLLRDVKCYSVDKEKLKILLLYAEQDLHDTDRQATAFNLLKAIITKKLSVPELYATMEKVSELSIISELDHVRLQSRHVCLQYILEYPLGKKLDTLVSFYISQLNYELQFGRESTLEMISGFINSFPLNTLKDYSGTFLVTLGASLVNDDVPDCRKMAADCLKSMLSRLPQQERDGLFDIAVLLFKDNKISHRQMAAHLCGLFILVEKETFVSKIKTLLLPVYSQFGLNDQNNQPGRFVLLKKDPESTENHEKERAKDHLYFQILQMLLKLCAQCPQFLKMKKDVEILATHIQTLLAHPHEWVRLAAAQFLGFVVSSIDVDHLAELITTNHTGEEGYLYSDPRNGVESLTLDLCSQLQPGSIREEFAQQIIKILIFVARVLEKVPLDSEGDSPKLNLLWITKRMRKIVNTEIVLAATSGTLRTEVFKWIAGVCTVINESNIKSALHHLLSPLVRELLTKDEGNAQLRGLAKEVCNLIKQKVGLSYYSSVLSKVQQQLSIKRAERKRVRTQLAVTDPEVYARKKIKQHEKKKISKKRKREELKGAKRNFKKRKVVDLEAEEIL